jgi:hypothetical protein
MATAQIQPVRYAHVGSGVERQRFKMPSSRRIGTTLTRFV